MVVVAALGVNVFFAARRGREIGEHLIDNEAPVAAAEPVPVPDTVVADGTEDPRTPEQP